MEENRSFDHMLGWMKRGGPNGDPRVNGLTGRECNYLNLTNKAAGQVCVNDQARDKCPYDPDHAFESTTERIFGCKYQAKDDPKGDPHNPCINHGSVHGSPAMSGFAYAARRARRSSAEHLIATKALRLHSYGLDAHCR